MYTTKPNVIYFFPPLSSTASHASLLLTKLFKLSLHPSLNCSPELIKNSQFIHDSIVRLTHTGLPCNTSFLRHSRNISSLFMQLVVTHVQSGDTFTIIITMATRFEGLRYAHVISLCISV